MRAPSSGSHGLPPQRRLAVMAAGAGATVVAAMFIALVLIQILYRIPGPRAAAGETTNVELRPGAGVSEIASTLARNHVVSSATVFAVQTKLSGASRRLKAGEYDIPSHASMAQVLDMVRKGLVVHRYVTIPEGMTSEAAVDILMASPFLTGAAPVPEEGTILPETYEVRRGEDRAEVLQKMTEARDKLMGELWAQRKEGLPYRSPQEAVILASIVEKETAKAEERPHVASVYLNRLRQSMRLQSDPTTIYGISRGKPLGRGIKMSELITATPYNTYAIDGLPVGPICNPGRAALAAVLDPADTKDLFFVANGSGGHVFAATPEEHDNNVRQWRKVEKSNPAWSTQTDGPVPPAQPAKRK